MSVRRRAFQAATRVCLVTALACLVALARSAPDDVTAPEPSSSADPVYALTGQPLVHALRGGGFTLYFRHTATDFSRLDGRMKDYRDCAHQRMLSDKGREEAREIGKAIAALRIPAGEVLASPYCRTTETATLMFGRAVGANEIREEAGNNYAALKRLLAKPAGARGTNRMIVGHGTPFRAIAGPPHLAEGEVAVLKPLGDRYLIVARITPGDWTTLLDVAARSGSGR
ncbi:MAG: histidine phosphatase family protein [Betaproteobacteria bacterium]